MAHTTQLALAIWTFYCIGVFLHAWMKASVVLVSKLNGINSYEQYTRIHAPALAIRFFVSTLGLLWWAEYPDSFSTLAHYMGWSSSLNVPLNIVTAGGYGLGSDALLDLVTARFSFLQKEIPPVGGSIVSSSETKITTTPDAVTETTTENTVVQTPAQVAVKTPAQVIVNTPAQVIVQAPLYQISNSKNTEKE